MKKKKSIEMKIYELLGIKLFKKFVLKTRDVALHFKTRKMTKEEKYDYIYNYQSNYHIGKHRDYESVKKFKRWLLFNASIHIFALTLFIPDIFLMINGDLSTSLIINDLIFIPLNMYCIMLQRYNAIRINQHLKRKKPKYEKQKEVLKKEVLSLEEKVKEKEKIDSEKLEQAINNPTIKELKHCRELLKDILVVEYFEKSNKNENIEDIEENKSLKLEFNKKTRF